MRYLFLALLFGNLAYFAWAHWVDVTPPAPVNEAFAKLPSLKLADEVPLDQRPLARQVSTEPAACFSVGPFADADNSAKALAIFKQKGFDPKQRSDEAQTQGGFWVFVTVKDQSDIDRALVTLEHGGVRDAIIMPVTPDVEGRRLSLGVYADRARAEKRAAVVGQTGLKAEVGERRLPSTQYWLDMAPLPGTNAISLQDLFAEGVSTKVAVQACPPAGSSPTSEGVQASAVPAHSRTISRPAVRGADASSGNPPAEAPAQLR